MPIITLLILARVILGDLPFFVSTAQGVLFGLLMLTPLWRWSLIESNSSVFILFVPSIFPLICMLRVRGNIFSLPPSSLFFLLLDTFDGRHLLWYSVTNCIGIILAAAVDYLDHCILNNDETAHYLTPTNSFSVPDPSIWSRDALLDFYWKVNEDLYGSE